MQTLGEDGSSESEDDGSNYGSLDVKGHRHAQARPFQQIRRVFHAHRDKLPVGGGSAALDLFGKASIIETCGV